MRAARSIRSKRKETGVALLISIFILLLISVVAIALIVSSGTETSLAGNYRSSTGVYYAALSGIEEARGRLSVQDPNSFKTTWATFYPAPGSTLPIGTVGYVYQQLTADSGSGDRIGAFESRVIGIGPQIGFLFPVETPAGIMQGYLNIKGYAEFDRQNRAAGFDTWVTFSISPAPQASAQPTLVRKY